MNYESPSTGKTAPTIQGELSEQWLKGQAGTSNGSRQRDGQNGGISFWELPGGGTRTSTIKKRIKPQNKNQEKGTRHKAEITPGALGV